MEGTSMDANRDHGGGTTLTGPLSRRAALRGIGGTGAAVALGLGARRHANGAAARSWPVAPASGTAPIEPTAGSWQTWILSAGDQLRPAAPPDAAATEAELAEL